MYAVFFQLACPLDVALFVEARFQLQQHRDLLAVFHCFQQGIDHRCVVTDAIERDFDSQHIWIVRCLLQQPHYRLKGIEGMLQQDIAAADGGEDVLLIVLHERRRLGRNEGRKLQVGPIDLGERAHPHQRQRAAGDLVDVLAIEFQVLHQDVEHGSRHRFIDFDAHYVGETALPHAFLYRFQQVAGLQVLNLAVGVAGDVKRMGLQNLHARKKSFQIGRHQLLQPHVGLIFEAPSWHGFLPWERKSTAPTAAACREF